MGSMLAAMFGCLMLVKTDNAFGASSGSVSWARASPASIRWWPRRSAGDSRITTRVFSTGSSRSRWWAACWLRRRSGYAADALGCRRGDGDSADRHFPGDGAVDADLAGIEGDRTMKRAAALFLVGCPGACGRPAGEHTEADRLLARRAHGFLGHTDRGPGQRQDALRTQPGALLRARVERQALQHRAGLDPAGGGFHLPNPRAGASRARRIRHASTDRCVWWAGATRTSRRARFRTGWARPQATRWPRSKTWPTSWWRAASGASMATSSATTPGMCGSPTPPGGGSTTPCPTTVRRYRR